jgi:DNA-binding NarL/FixJ family response regulator
MQESKQIRVLLAEDHAIVREGLRSMLEKQPGIEIVCEAEDGQTAVERAQELLPDVVIMDITMPNFNGIEATRKIINEFPQIKVIALSIHSDRRFITAMLCAGAAGYVLKEDILDELVKAIRAVTDGEKYLSSKITGIVVKDYAKSVTTIAYAPLSSLTNKERKMLRLIAAGKSTEQIALDLLVSIKTVEANRRKIMKKLNVHTIADLVKIAIIENLVALES